MPTFTVDDTLDIDLEDVYDARIRIICGDVLVTAGEGPAHLSVKIVSGDPVEVVHELEALRVYHPETSPQGIWRLVDGWSAGRRPEAIVELRVPPNTPLDVTTVQAGVVVTGLQDTLRVNTVSGDVALKDVNASVDVKTVSGQIDVLSLTGDLKAKTVSGSVTVANGKARTVDAKTVSGSVSLDVGLDPDGVYDVATVSGSAGLLLPPDAGFRIDATTMSGRLVNDFGLDWERRPGRRRLDETVGSGGARLSLKTLSGEVRLLRKQVAA